MITPRKELVGERKPFFVLNHVKYGKMLEILVMSSREIGIFMNSGITGEIAKISIRK